MASGENPVKCGSLLFPPHGVLGQLKKSWQKKYCQLFKCSKFGIDRLEVFDGEEEVGKTSSNLIITLENCVKIMQDPQKHQLFAFAVITKSVSYYFSASSEEDMNEWISAFQSVAFKDNASRQTIEEDNDLYCPSGDAGVFRVKLVTSDASERCRLCAGEYTLIVTSAALQLLDSEEERILFTWPYRFIRKYGYRAGKFTFEAGRKCDSGEGVFHFEHSNQQEIFRCISTKMKKMKTLLSGSGGELSSNFSSQVDCQFQAAMSMMARSRSPLPPSPVNSSLILDADITQIPVKPLMPLPTNAPATLTEIDEVPPPLKPKSLPQKPPRKLPPKEATDADSNGTANKPLIASNGTANKPLIASNGTASKPLITVKTPDYDDVEERSEAWRTMGVNTMSHTEPAFDLNQLTRGQLISPQSLTISHAESAFELNQPIRGLQLNTNHSESAFELNQPIRGLQLNANHSESAFELNQPIRGLQLGANHSESAFELNQPIRGQLISNNAESIFDTNQQSIRKHSEFSVELNQQPTRKLTSILAESAININQPTARVSKNEMSIAAPLSVDNYDRLQHIGRLAKFSTAPGYKRLPLFCAKTSPFSNEEPIFSCRRAGDFQGYGMIRKKSMPDLRDEIGKNTFIRDIEYAAVRKSNRV